MGICRIGCLRLEIRAGKASLEVFGGFGLHYLVGTVVRILACRVRNLWRSVVSLIERRIYLFGLGL